MADIRLSSGIKDDFNRADENPILGPTGVEWSRTESGVWGAGAVRGNTFTVPAGGSTTVNSYWNQETYDGDDAQVWAFAGGGGVISGLSYRLALWKTPGNGTTDGYYFRSQYLTGDDREELFRVDNGGANLTELDFRDGFNVQGRQVLLRRNGSDVEVWQTVDEGGPSTVDVTAWEMILNATDTTYTTGFYLALGISDNSGNGEGTWDYFGGGPNKWMPEFIRRPWRYQGRALDLSQ